MAIRNELGQFVKGHGWPKGMLAKMSKTKTIYPTLEYSCKNCKKLFLAKVNKHHTYRTFCSNTCRDIVGIMGGRKHSAETREKMSKSAMGSNNHRWKGEDVGVTGIHIWLKMNYGKADQCDNGKDKIFTFICTKKYQKFNWAVIHEKGYKRRRENFLKLCTSCHAKYDSRTREKVWKNHKFNLENLCV